ncbi:MAG: aldo/keto reductase [Planctomycetes bacterium]|nr:aldo/keto reductase [Planctomycetota bacterium]
MRQVPIPRCSLVTSRIAFGTASVHHLTSARERLRLLDACVAHGITHFDTAPMYGEGMAERTLGALLASNSRSSVTVATKVGFPPRYFSMTVPPLMYLRKTVEGGMRRMGVTVPAKRRRELAASSLESCFVGSLRRLGTDYVDILFVHEPTVEEADRIEDVAAWCMQQRRGGRARYIGLAGHAADAATLARRVPDVFDILQVEDSLAGCDADAVLSAGYPLQITYGYFRTMHRERGVSQAEPVDAAGVMQAAFERNPFGAIIVSTRSASRVVDLARLASMRS